MHRGREHQKSGPSVRELHSGWLAQQLSAGTEPEQDVCRLCITGPLAPAGDYRVTRLQADLNLPNTGSPSLRGTINSPDFPADGNAVSKPIAPGRKCSQGAEMVLRCGGWKECSGENGGETGLFPTFPAECPSGHLGLALSDEKFLLLRLLFLAKKPFPYYTRTPQGTSAGSCLLFQIIGVLCFLFHVSGERGSVSFLCVLALLPLPFLQQTGNYN